MNNGQAPVVRTLQGADDGLEEVFIPNEHAVEFLSRRSLGHALNVFSCPHDVVLQRPSHIVRVTEVKGLR